MMGELVRRVRHYRHLLVGPGMTRGSRLSKNMHLRHSNSFVEWKREANKAIFFFRFRFDGDK